MECRGENFTSAVTLGNPDILVGSGMIMFPKLWLTFLTNTFTVQTTRETKECLVQGDLV